MHRSGTDPWSYLHKKMSFKNGDTIINVVEVSYKYKNGQHNKIDFAAITLASSSTIQEGQFR